MAGILTESKSTMMAQAMSADISRFAAEDGVSEGDVTRAAAAIGLLVMADMSRQLRMAEYAMGRMGEPPVWRIRRRKR